ncbi:methylthioribulose 1-phosphate dehydratase [Ponticaulis sp.]|uniref:methylthioribulose 1-phosphate dehydratase n=1 Tax=Ponticaulis sp. TaxID=2020902 RepID=UPI000B65190A|nr:methylthioribulose 1-phosphate dehydratase [Ponticaulis sp.]MAI91838.1 methylthioribulose 1-phosphate dehydratase [Ponticaulis sp.]OUX96523.1 MAG: methylthioribulose 1-phosphate dehydratase [Hyphomonadaceae bacterium TMED5]|tara:strand:- start:3795 stop:4448 length:654 start_codon:yes stop_codon:yes gene_type:complete
MSELITNGPVSFETAARNICEAGRILDSKAMAPATSGNYSMRVDDGSFAITASGFHKGRLIEDNVMRVDAEGKALEPKKPSAETLLHTQIYRHYPGANAILHVHSGNGVVLTRLLGGDVLLAGYEMLKVFPGVNTHEVKVRLKTVDNTQDMPALAELLEPEIAGLAVPVYVIRDHGFYVWGKDMDECLNMCEAVDHMLGLELQVLTFKGLPKKGFFV